MGMTNEFAIKVLTELKGYGDKFANIGFDRKEALDMAIKILEQQPCEDCISREAVIKIFGEVHPMDYNTQAYITNIQNLPSVTPSISDVENNFDIGYNCGYADAMIDISEGE